MNIFGYLFVSKSFIQIYSDIHSYHFLDTNIFRYSFVSKMFIRIYSDIRSYHFLDTNIFGYSFVSKSIRMSHSDLKCLILTDIAHMCVLWNAWILQIPDSSNLCEISTKSPIQRINTFHHQKCQSKHIKSWIRFNKYLRGAQSL